MTVLKLTKLKEIIKKAYEAGYNGCMEMVEEFTDEMLIIVQKEIASKEHGDGEWRIWLTEELKKKSVGTLFEHSRLGRCWIDGRSEKDKCMRFENGDHRFFIQNIEPWDELMREIGKL